MKLTRWVTGYRRFVFVLTSLFGCLFGSISLASPVNFGTPKSDCPKVEFSISYWSVYGGDTVEIEAAVPGKFRENLRYNWKVSDGEIISGQNTPKITVLTPKTKKRLKIDVSLQIDEPENDSKCDLAGQTAIFIKGPQDLDHGPSRLVALILNKEILYSCNVQNRSSLPSPVVNVIAIPQDIADPRGLKFGYRVSGGKLIGAGARVEWDLSGTPPGTYAITAGVDDGCGFCGSLLSRFVTVKACPLGEPSP